MYRADPMVIFGVILFWVVLGLAVFFVAMRGGPRGARGALHTESKLGQRVVMLVVVLRSRSAWSCRCSCSTANGDNKASVAVGGVHLNAEEQHGRVLFSESCAVCHTLAADQRGRSRRTQPRHPARLGDHHRSGPQGARAERDRRRPCPRPRADAGAALPGSGRRSGGGLRGRRRRSLRAQAAVTESTGASPASWGRFAVLCARRVEGAFGRRGHC